jgi:hypothetical protein
MIQYNAHVAYSKTYVIRSLIFYRTCTFYKADKSHPRHSTLYTAGVILDCAPVVGRRNLIRN